MCRCRNHLENIKTNVASGKIVFGGASLEEPIKEGQPAKINGSALLLCADSEEEAMEVVKSDLYYSSNVWDRSKVRLSQAKKDRIPHKTTT